MFQKSGFYSPVEVGSLSHCLQGLGYIPGGAGILPATVLLGEIQNLLHLDLSKKSSNTCPP